MDMPSSVDRQPRHFSALHRRGVTGQPDTRTIAQSRAAWAGAASSRARSLGGRQLYPRSGHSTANGSVAPADAEIVFGQSSEGFDLLMSIADRAARHADDPQLEVWRQRALATAAHHVGRSDLVRRAWWAASAAGEGIPGVGRVMASMRVAAYGALADLARYDEMRACSESWTRAVRGRYESNGAWVAATCDIRPMLDDAGRELVRPMSRWASLGSFKRRCACSSTEQRGAVPPLSSRPGALSPGSR